MLLVKMFNTQGLYVKFTIDIEKDIFIEEFYKARRINRGVIIDTADEETLVISADMLNNCMFVIEEDS